jgi:hypothetical protein
VDTKQKRVGLKIMITIFMCVLLDLSQDLLRCHEPKVSVEADTGQLRDVSLADTV